MLEAASDIHVPKGSLNIPRAKMPQIRSDLVPEFVDELEAAGVRVERMKKIGVAKLKPTQQEINNEKVVKMLSAPPSVLAKPVIVSKDFYILDGHHRWLALLNSKPDFKIQTYFVHLPIRQLLKRANSFGKVSYKSIVERIDHLLAMEGKAAYDRGTAKLSRDISNQYGKSDVRHILDHLDRIPPGDVEPLETEGGIRPDGKGNFWLMNRLDRGWAEHGKPYKSLAAIQKKYKLRVIDFRKDKHGDYWRWARA